MLFRGTNDMTFERTKQLGFYYGLKYFDSYITSASPDAMSAMVSGKNRCMCAYYMQFKAKPVLIAIKPDNYSNSLRKGLENCEIEIIGKIDFKNVIRIDSIEKLLSINPLLKKEEIEYFRTFYLKNGLCQKNREEVSRL